MSRRLTVYLSTLLIGLSLCLASQAQNQVQNQAQYIATPVTPPRAEQLLRKMSSALQSAAYNGEFTYEYGTQLESYRIAQYFVEGERRETLERLTGAESSLLRKGDAGCGTIGGRMLSGASLTSSEGSYFGLDRYYSASVIGRDRIAERATWVLQLLPKDEHRFGRILSIDEQTGMLLRQVIFDARKKEAMERMQFVSINTNNDASTAEAEPVYQVLSQRCVGETYSPEGHSPWKPSWQPPGFVQTAYAFDEDVGHMETYTDGISSFTVFTRAGEVSTEPTGIQQAVSSRGASMALLTERVTDGSAQQISVVGEIPLSVAQKVSLAVRPAAADAIVPE